MKLRREDVDHEPTAGSARWALVLAICAWAVGTSGAMTSSAGTVPGGDREAVLAHIDSIFQAYVRQDRETIRSTHSEDWVGFQGPSTQIERGIDDYMVNAETSLEHLRGTGYEILDTEVQLFGDLALVYYVARYDYVGADGKPGSLGLRSLDVYRRVEGEWTQIGSHIGPLPAGGVWGEGTPEALPSEPR